MEEIIQSAGIARTDLANISKQSDVPLAEFPSLLIKEEEQYLKEAMKNM
ncbi:hypothetical protein [Bacillus pseudomycoides]|nr:hypothetical protein [Bacillus pseudomycoides]